MTGLNSCRNIHFFLLIYCLETASLEDEVVASVGGSVLLPCLLSAAPPPPASVSVFWRDKDDNVVLDIKRNADDLVTQNEKFKGRVFGGQKRYETGNFSIELKDVQRADAGLYECHVPSVDFQRGVRLTVSGERVEATPPPGPSGAGPSDVSTTSLTNYSEENQQQYFGRVCHSELIVYGSLTLNVIFVIVGLGLTSLCLKRKICSHQVNEPSPFNSENPEMHEGPQYEEIQLRARPPAPECIYHKAQLPESPLPPHH